MQGDVGTGQRAQILCFTCIKGAGGNLNRIFKIKEIYIQP